MNVEQKLEVLNNRMFKLLKNKPYSANRNHVNKIEVQMRYLEKFVPKAKEKDN